METFTRQQSLEAFLPSRVAALPHVVEMVDPFAMRLDEAALQAARRQNWERAGALISDVECDILGLARAAQREEVETLNTIGPFITRQRIFHALAESDDLEAVEALYRWAEQNATPVKFLSRLLSRAATNGRMDVLEFAVEKTVERYSPELVLSKKSCIVWDALGAFLYNIPELQSWFYRTFHEALNNYQQRIAGLLYASLLDSQRLSLFYYLVRNDSSIKGAVFQLATL